MKHFLESIFGPGRELPRWLRTVLWLVLALLVLAYAGAALKHGKKQNVNFDYNDQRVYMNYARGMVDSNYEMFVTRMRMPMYMWLLSLAATPKQEYKDFFPIAQAFSVVISLVCLGCMFLALRKWLGNWIGVCFVLVVGGQVFVLRAPYVQPELVLTTIITITVAWLAHALRHPGWRNGLICGLLLCAWFFTKASAQIALGLFGMFLGMKWLVAERGKKMPLIVCGLVTLASYLIPMTPYLWTSYKVFHDPFYNVQGKYYMWANVADNETVDRKEDEKHGLQKLGLDRNFDNITEEQRKNLPSAGKYWREHSMKEIRQRLMKGTDLMFRAAFTEYTTLYFMIALWAGIALWAMALHWPEAVDFVLRWKWEIVFVTALVALFAFLFGWFVPLKAGPRLINSVALVPLFFATAATHRMLGRTTWRVLDCELSAERVLTFAFVVAWSVLTFFDVPPNLELQYFGG